MNRFLRLVRSLNKFRIFGNRIFNIFISTIFNHRLTDLGSGLNIYKTTYLKNKFYSNFPNSLSFNVFMLLYGVYSKSKFSFFALTWREDDQVSNAKLLKQTKEILNLIYKYVLNKRNLFNGAENEYSKINYNSELIYTTKLKS